MAETSKLSPVVKSIVTSLAVIIIGGFAAFTYKNIEFPKHKKQEDEIEKKIDDVNDIEKDKTLQFEMLKLNVNSNTIKLDYMIKKIDEMSEGQKEMLKWLINANRERKEEYSKN